MTESRRHSAEKSAMRLREFKRIEHESRPSEASLKLQRAPRKQAGESRLRAFTRIARTGEA